MGLLHLENISKKFGPESVLEDLSLVLSGEQVLSILGKSGCGKTTLLKIIAGLENEDSGHIILDGNPINNLAPQKRGIVYLYQEALLFPHLNVFDNIAFGLRLKKEDGSAVEDKVHAMLEQLELSGQEKKMPHQLSGGQKQRVSFGRALIINPNVLLLDEPFGNLDAITRQSMQVLFKKVASEFRITSIFVTHDLKEALFMADMIGLMERGNLKLFKSVHEFVRDPNSGVGTEIEFWKQLDEKQP